MTIDEVRAFIDDHEKHIAGNIVLRPARDHPDAFEFIGTVEHEGIHDVQLNIYFNPDASTPKITFAFFVKGIGRVYGLCVNVSHNKMLIHKHNGKKGDDQPYFPGDVTASADNPSAVWDEFCVETSLIHNGEFLIAGG